MHASCIDTVDALLTIAILHSVMGKFNATIVSFLSSYKIQFLLFHRSHEAEPQTRLLHQETPDSIGGSSGERAGEDHTRAHSIYSGTDN
jgi:hypothetical protein